MGFLWFSAWYYQIKIELEFDMLRCYNWYVKLYDQPWISELQLSQISDFGRNVVSNYIFMKEIVENINGKGV